MSKKCPGEPPRGARFPVPLRAPTKGGVTRQAKQGPSMRACRVLAEDQSPDPASPGRPTDTTRHLAYLTSFPVTTFGHTRYSAATRLKETIVAPASFSTLSHNSTPYCTPPSEAKHRHATTLHPSPKYILSPNVCRTSIKSTASPSPASIYRHARYSVLAVCRPNTLSLPLPPQTLSDIPLLPSPVPPPPPTIYPTPDNRSVTRKPKQYYAEP
ncbi:hypothetical protein JTB14_006471 [Gonioctena quinquepunctata]|nr:hypothetical protein JTB14_006471 [Gonioctena quinquepunctata]